MLADTNINTNNTNDRGTHLTQSPWNPVRFTSDRRQGGEAPHLNARGTHEVGRFDDHQWGEIMAAAGEKRWFLPSKRGGVVLLADEGLNNTEITARLGSMSRVHASGAIVSASIG